MIQRRVRHSIFFLFAVWTGATLAAVPADLVLLNGHVYPLTSHQAKATATAIAVTGSVVRFVGSDKDARALIGEATRVIDLHGGMVLPGFQDSHVHPAYVPNPATQVDLHDIREKSGLFERIHQFALAHPELPWIAGDGWDEVAFLPSGQPDRAMLDALVPDRPAFFTNNSGHEAWVNTQALALAHITAATPDPANGRIERDKAGIPTGALQEDSAMDLVLKIIPPPTAAENLATLSAALTTMASLGFTALEDAMVTPELVSAYRTLADTSKLPVRASLCLPFRPELDDEAQIESFIVTRASLTGADLTATCVKLFLDGAYASHTLALLAPYSDEPEKYGAGYLFIEAQRLNRLVTRLDALGFRVHVHAQGDGAVHAALDAFEAAKRSNGARDNRHTIAHLCLIAPADLARFKALNVIANFSPLWSLGDTWETVFAPKLFGATRSAHIFQMRSLLAHNATLVYGSDWPVTGVAALDGLETAITHRYPGGKHPDGYDDTTWNPSERITLPEAIRAYTINGAYLLHDEDRRGTLAVGKQADLVVLHQDLYHTLPLAIHAVPVDLTVHAGTVTYRRTDL